MDEVPLCPSLLAVIVAVPAVIACTSPVEETVAMASLLDDHATGRERMLLCASSNVAVNCSVSPWITVALVGATVTDATGAWVTVMVALPVLPSLVALMLAVPTVTAVTTPCAETVATAVLLELHVTARPVRTLLFASRVVAVACDVPTAVIELGVSATVTDATGTGTTVIVEVPECPSLVAVMVAPPTAIPVTSPEGLTVATAVLLEDQVMTRPLNTLLLMSLV